MYLYVVVNTMHLQGQNPFLAGDNKMWKGV